MSHRGNLTPKSSWEVTLGALPIRRSGRRLLSFRSIAVASLCVAVLLVTTALWSLSDGVTPVQGHPHEPHGTLEPTHPAPTPTPTPVPARAPRSDAAAPVQKKGSVETQPTTQDGDNKSGSIALVVAPAIAGGDVGTASGSVREFHATPVPNRLRSRFSDSAPVPAGILKTVRESEAGRALVEGNLTGVFNVDTEPIPPPGQTGAPASITTIDKPFNVSATSTSSITVAWADTDRYPAGADIYRDGRLVARLGSGTDSFIDQGLAPNTRYVYVVQGETPAGDTETSQYAITTLASEPEVAIFMARKPGSFQVPIVNITDPDYTEYRVLVFDGGVLRRTTNWSAERCVDIRGMVPGRTYVVQVHARNLDGVVTTTPVNVAGEPFGSGLLAWTPASLPANGEWAKREINAAADIYGLTDEARAWMHQHIQVVRMVGEPGWAGVWANYLGIGHPGPWTMMHEAMHLFWSYWDGFPESCDQLNLHSFRRDVRTFMVTFRALDNQELANPMEQWRPYYESMTRGLPDRIDGESTATILENEQFYRLWHYLYHVHETNVPAFAAQNLSLIPPRLRRYYVGFLKDDGRETSWHWESRRRMHLQSHDRDLWDTAYGPFSLPQLQQWRFPHVAHNFRTGRLSEPLRTQIDDARRQKLIDFIETLPAVAGNGYFRTCHNPDRGFGSRYVREHFGLSLSYLHDIYPELEHLALSVSEREAVVSAWQTIFDGPLYHAQGRQQVLDRINADMNLPSRYRDAFASVVAMVEKYEYQSQWLSVPFFRNDGPFGTVAHVTDPRSVDPRGPQNVVVYVDNQRRIRVEWDAPTIILAPGWYRTNFSNECGDSVGGHFRYDESIMESGRNRATYPPYHPGNYQICIALTNGDREYEVCHQNVLVE